MLTKLIIVFRIITVVAALAMIPFLIVTWARGEIDWFTVLGWANAIVYMILSAHEVEK